MKRLMMKTIIDYQNDEREKVLLDVRDKQEFEKETYPGARNWYWEELIKVLEETPEEFTQQFDKSVPIYLLCYTGLHSDDLADILEEMGYEVYSLYGGWGAYMKWKFENYVKEAQAENDLSGEERVKEIERSIVKKFRKPLYSKAKELGCNKIALGHHYDDVIETILMGMLYGAQIQTMMPKLHSTNFEGMELIRPLYLIREADIIHWRDYNNLAFIQCACRLTESCASCGGTEKGSKRGEIKQLIKDLTKVSPYIEKNIFRSVENVNLDTVIAYKQYGVKHNFLERYDEMGRLNGASGSQTADNKEME